MENLLKVKTPSKVNDYSQLAVPPSAEELMSRNQAAQITQTKELFFTLSYRAAVTGNKA